MSTLAKFMIVAVATVSTQVMAAKDPFAAMEPAGNSQHGNMSKDTLKPLKIFSSKEKPETASPKASAAKTVTEPQTEIVESKEVVKPKASLSETTTESKEVAQSKIKTVESKEIAKQETSAAEINQKPEKESDSGISLENFTAKTEKFLDEVTFSRGVNNALFQDGETD